MKSPLSWLRSRSQDTHPDQGLPHTIRVCVLDLADGTYTSVLEAGKGPGGWQRVRMYPGCPTRDGREDCLRTYVLQPVPAGSAPNEAAPSNG